MSGLLCFSLVFAYSISNVQLSNLFFYPYLIKQTYLSNYKLKFNTKILLPTILFIVISIFSIFYYSVKTSDFNTRVLIQIFFTFQYLILCLDYNVNIFDVEKKLVLYARFLSFFIIIVFFIKGAYLNIDALFTSNRLYGQGILPGWPNSTALPLIFTIWILLKNNTKLTFDILLFSISSILTTSRMAIIAVLLLWIYFWIIKPNISILKGKMNKTNLFIILISIFFLCFLYALLMNNESFLYRLGVTYDRENIFVSTIEYIKNSPFLGYGGNTIEQLYGNVSNNLIIYNWQHTHNAFLEIALRYGLGSLSFFMIMLFVIFREQKSLDNKIMFLILIMLATSQILIRNFTFLLYISLLNLYNTKKNQMEVIRHENCITGRWFWYKNQ